MPDISIQIEMKIQKHRYLHLVDDIESTRARRRKLARQKHSSICTHNSSSNVADNIELAIMLNCTQFMIEVGICALKNVRLYA